MVLFSPPGLECWAPRSRLLRRLYAGWSVWVDVIEEEKDGNVGKTEVISASPFNAGVCKSLNFSFCSK